MIKVILSAIIALVFISTGCNSVQNKKEIKKLNAEVKTKRKIEMEHLTKETFQEKVFNYEGKINIYKVDTEAEQELAAAFGIRSIPSLLFCPAEGQPQMAQGALPKATFIKAIDEILLNKNEVEAN